MEAEEVTKKCGNCALCVHTYLGSECGITDNKVEDETPGCIDWLAEGWAMERTEFNSSVSTEIRTCKLMELYARLDTEEQPYELVVHQPSRRRRIITIYCNDAAYFNNLLNGFKA